MQIARPRVVAQAFPSPENTALRGSCQGVNRWKAGHPALEMGQHCSHPRLLEHHLGDPDTIGVNAETPWQDTRIPRVPPEDACGKVRHEQVPATVWRAARGRDMT